MTASLLAVLNDAERSLAAETEPAKLAALDEDAAIELETRIRRARDKYVSQYRRAASARVAEHGGRGKAAAENTRAALKAEPQRYIAQPTLALSTCPVFTRKGFAPRHVDLRPFVLVSPNGVEITPGGLTRVALKQGSLVVNSSQGGGTKDTWVLKD